MPESIKVVNSILILERRIKKGEKQDCSREGEVDRSKKIRVFWAGRKTWLVVQVQNEAMSKKCAVGPVRASTEHAT